LSPRAAAHAVGATVVVAGALAYLRQGPQLLETWRAATPAWDKHSDAPPPSARDFIDEGRYSVSSSVTAVCDGMKTRDAQAECVPRRARPHLSTLYANPYLYRCVRVRVPARGWTEIQLPALPRDADLIVLGSNIPAGPRRASIEVRTSATDDTWRPLQKLSRLSVRVEDFASEQPIIALQNEGSRDGVACVAVAAVERPPPSE
jgi:hypothetical protein